MGVAFNHTIVRSADREEAARFFTDIFGLPPAQPFGPFLNVALEHGGNLDFAATDQRPPARQHYAFLVSEDDFDAIFGRLAERDIQYWADPSATRPGEINHHDGGRGIYFRDPSGHWLEIITRPYGSGESS